MVNGREQGPAPAGGSGGEGCVVVVTSGKGGVGKTTSAASLGMGLAQVWISRGRGAGGLGGCRLSPFGKCVVALIVVASIWPFDMAFVRTTWDSSVCVASTSLVNTVSAEWGSGRN